MPLELLNRITSDLTLTHTPDGWQVSLHKGGNSFRVRTATTVSEAVREVVALEPLLPVPPAP